MSYYHKNIQNQRIDLPIGKVVCIGRNYIDHVNELNNSIPSEPILFIKPTSALVPFENKIKISDTHHSVHYELEIAVLIQNILKNASYQQVKSAILGLGIALDLTLRELQDKLKKNGHPWDKAKSFDNSCPVSQFITNKNLNLTQLELLLNINKQKRQHAFSHQMIFDIVSLIAYASSFFTLNPGDIILTGTPSGVGALKKNDKLNAQLVGYINTTTIVE